MPTLAEIIAAATAAMTADATGDLARKIDPSTITIARIRELTAAVNRRRDVDVRDYAASNGALNQIGQALRDGKVATRRLLAAVEVGSVVDREWIVDLSRQLADEGSDTSSSLDSAAISRWTASGPGYRFVIEINDGGFWTRARREDATGVVRELAVC